MTSTMSEMMTMTSSTRTAAATVSSECGPENTSSSSNEEEEGGDMERYDTKLNSDNCQNKMFLMNYSLTYIPNNVIIIV